MDCTEDGRRVKVMPVVEEYSRECLTLEMERSITSEKVVDTLRRLFIERGAPDYIRSDNGPPEFVARAVKRWLAVCGVGTLYIEPGSPWENAFHEKALPVKADVAAVTPSETATLAPLLMLPSALSVGSFW